MVTKGLIVRVEAKSGQEERVAAFLRDALSLAQQEAKTVAWFAFRLGPSSFAIVDAFPDEAGRRAHLEGPIAAALEENALELLAATPLIEPVDVTLLWHPADDSTSIELWYVATDERFRFVVPSERALDAFYHPLLHLHTEPVA